MSDPIQPTPTPSAATPPPALAVFFMVFFPVWLLVVISATLITFILPESFVGKARVRAVSQPGAVLEQLRSNATLAAVAERLDLGKKWGDMYPGGATLNRSEVVTLLEKRLRIGIMPNTGLIEIEVFNEKPTEAADIANAMAETSRPGARIVDLAVPALRPARPNKPLNISLGILAGVLLGSLAGFVAVRLSRGLVTKSGVKLVIR